MQHLARTEVCASIRPDRVSMNSRRFAPLGWLLCFCVVISAQSPVETSPNKPAGNARKQAAVVRNFYQTGPGDNIEPSKPTEAMIGYDARTLYFAFHCYDEPDKVRASVAKRDEVFNEDNVRIFLDTFNDQRRAYVLGFNPLGVQADGIM